MAFWCPTFIEDYPLITMAHGGGGRLTQRLIEEVFLPAFKNEYLEQKSDSAHVAWNASAVVTSTDSFVVKPIFFPGGDIGSLSIYGSANDVLMGGALPEILTAGFILEEGLAVKDLCRIVSSMAEAANISGLRIVAGDTKVVEKGAADSLFITTTAIGRPIFVSCSPSPQKISAGDTIILSGDIGRHGAALLALRNNLELSYGKHEKLQSDCAFLGPVIEQVKDFGPKIHCMRDLTRGGLGAALDEVSKASGFDFEIFEKDIFVSPEVGSVCELFGLDPTFVACEGRMVLFVSEDCVREVLLKLSTESISKNSRVIGRVLPSKSKRVILNSKFGSRRLLQLFSGEQLPRIC